MRPIILITLVMAFAMTLVAGLVLGLGDRTVFVPPPEAVVEDFVRKLVAERYERALESLSDDLALTATPETLKRMTERFKQRTGEILDVRGERGWIEGERAQASTSLKTSLLGAPTLTFSLTRQSGVWSINDLSSIEEY